MTEPADRHSPPGVERIFMGWDRPILDLAVEYLCRNWFGGPLQLDDQLLIVPTAQSARRLRQALAARAAEEGTGVLAPTVITPEALLQLVPHDRPAASALEARAVLTACLMEADLDQFPHLFPAEARPERQDYSWSAGAAATILEMRSQLGERGLTIADAASELAVAFEERDAWEPERWDDLVRLEALQLKRLDDLGLEDANRRRRQAVRKGFMPEGIRRIALIGVPDPLPLAVEMLEHVSARVPVSVLVHAPADLAEHIDTWGRPGPHWLDPQTCIDISDEVIHLVAKPQDQAAAVLELFSRVGDGTIALGVPDSDVIPHLQLRLRELGLSSYDPAGIPLKQTPIHELLELLLDLATEDRFETFAALMRHPDFSVWVHPARKGGRRVDCAGRPDLAAAPSQRPRSLSDHQAGLTGILARLDRLQNDHLPIRFSEAAEWARRKGARGDAGDSALAAACLATQSLLEQLAHGFSSGEHVLGVLQSIYAERRLDDTRPADRQFADAAALVSDFAGRLGSDPLVSSLPDPSERMRLVLEVLGQQRLYDDASDTDVELDGWLELHWNDAPNLVVTGFNEGSVPESIVGHAFLPDVARQALGLLTNDRRLARDAYLLTAMRESRRRHGSLHIVLGKVSSNDDARKPSRLLLRCADEILPGRALQLFRELEAGAVNAAWQRAWQLCPPLLDPPRSIAVTGLRDYLACPFRFYLKRVVGMERQDDRKAELDALDFGNLCHSALEAFAKHDGLRDCCEPGPIAEFLLDQAHTYVRERFGATLNAALTVQLEAACQRLRAAAGVQAREREAGWRIMHSEYRLGAGNGFELEGLVIRGTVDRIEQHEDGRWRILDYKTSEKARGPAEVHLGSVPPALDEDSDVFHRIAQAEGKMRCWNDLQLPLYMLSLQRTFGPIAQCGYFLLPKAVSETGVAIWDGFGPDLLAAAEACSRAVARSIRQGRFWPPAEKVSYDDFERILFGNAAGSVDPECAASLTGNPAGQGDLQQPTP